MPGRASDAVLQRLTRLHPKVIDLALDRVEALLAKLDHPERCLPPVVHVAGTNGKGSTVANLRAITEAGGGSAHVYTSPHLVRFAERIRVAGTIIADQALVALLEECEAINGDDPITFFEVTTAAAFLAFARTPADVCLLETGLGGRVDATNVIAKPAMTILTSISLDHQAYLGDTLGAIAGEKAGILKPGVPCVVAAQEPEARAVIEARAAELDVPLLLEGRDWRIAETSAGCRLEIGAVTLDLPPPALPGPHQIHNAGLAAVAAHRLGVAPAMIAHGITTAEWPARLQRLHRGPLIERLPPGVELWLDGGHNPGAGVALAEFIKRHWTGRPTNLVVGMLNTKDSQGFLDPLAPLVQKFRAVAIPDDANARPAEDLVAMAKAAGLDGGPAVDLANAVGELASGSPPPRILVCGSLHLAGVVLGENG